MKFTINAKLILNLQSSDERKRISHKNFFVRIINQKNKFYMSFEEVGKCDDYIWRFHQSKEDQDSYWPFVDFLHTHHIFRGTKNIKIKNPEELNEKELNFPPTLEELYQKSLKLKIK